MSFDGSRDFLCFDGARRLPRIDQILSSAMDEEVGETLSLSRMQRAVDGGGWPTLSQSGLQLTLSSKNVEHDQLENGVCAVGGTGHRVGTQLSCW